MENKQYISVSEFAKRVNLSRQAVYNKIDKELTPFVKLDLQTNRKTIDIKALQLFDNLQEVNKKNVNVDSQVDNLVDTKDSVNDSKEDENLRLLITQLQTQLEEKNNEINELKTEKKELKEELKQSHEHSRNLSNDLVRLNENQQILLKQSIENQEKLKEIEAPKDKKIWNIFKK